MTGWTLEFLTARDQELLAGSARRACYAPGEVILAQGSRQRELYRLHSGFVRVTRKSEGREITVAQLGPGEIFGEISLLEHAGASASVIAEETVEVDVVSEAHLLALTASEPGFSTRFYHSLATELAGRLRAATLRMLELGTDQLSAQQFRLPRTGMVSERQIPAPLVRGVEAVRVRLWQVEQGLRDRTLSSDEAERSVHAVCSSVVELLQEFTRQEQVMEIGWSDLLAFRDPEQVTAGVGTYMFRKTFSFWMESALMARCYAKPSGIPTDWETLSAMYRNEPQGDGLLGPLIDAWFLARPVCAGWRAGRAWMAGRVSEALAGATPGSPFYVTALGTGSATVLLDLVAQAAGAVIHVTCVDSDQRALHVAAEQLEACGPTARVNLVQANVRELAEGDLRFSQPPQNVICAFGALDNAADNTARAALRWACAQLAPGGRLLWSVPSASHPDRALMEHLLEWRMHLRLEEEVRSLVRASCFDGSTLLVPDSTGTLHLADSTRDPR